MNRFIRVILAILAAFIGAAATACDGKNLSRDKAAEIVTREYTDKLGRLCQLNAALATKPEFAALKQEPICTARVEVTGIRKVSESESAVEFSVVREPRSAVAKQWLTAFDALTSRLGTVRAAHGFSMQHMGMIWQFTDPADGQKFIGLAGSGQPEAIRDTPEWKALAGLRQLVAAMVDSGKWVVSEKPHSFRLYDDGWRLEKSQAERDADIQAKQSEASVSSGRGAAVAAGPTPARGEAGRCAEDSTGLPPKKNFIRRVLDRWQQKHASYPDSLVYVARGASVGTIRFLQSGEVCVGTSLASYTPALFRDSRSLAVALTAASAISGFRLLALMDTDWGFQAMWIVHPDSMTALSGDLLADYRMDAQGRLGGTGRAQISLGWPQSGNWDPTGRVLAAPAGWGDVGGQMLVAGPGDSKARLINLQTTMQADTRCFSPQPAGLPRWNGTSTFEISVHLDRHGACALGRDCPCNAPVDTAATVLVDPRAGVATRLR